MRRPRLRSRVLWLTSAFAVVLFAVTFGLSWRANQSQERWSRLIRVETEATATLEELVRAQNAYRARFDPADPAAVEHYRVVAQLLQKDSLQWIDTGTLRARIRAFREVIGEPAPRPEDVAATSSAVVAEAQRIAEERKREIARQLPELERDTRDMMRTGLAIAWIIVLVSFAVVQTTLRKVVRPLEEISTAADRISAGDLTARAPVAGDREIATLAVALNRMSEELKARARTDELTGLPNFRAFVERIEGEIERAGRYPEEFGVLILDLDRFKKYNDTYGHAAGNGALQRVARVIREALRTVDFPARYGGEEFAVVVPNIDAPSLAVIAERIRAGVEALPAPKDGAQVTVSIGAAIYPADGGSREALFRSADERLYEAKRQGRNRVIAPPPNARSAVPASA